MTTDAYPGFYIYQRIVQSKLFIDRHFADPINLDDIADEALFSKFHFIRLFKKTYGKTPHQYLTHVRIEKAKELLQSAILVTEVCGEVGFDSITSFTDLFKRRVGETPSTYQSRQQALRKDIAKTPLKYIPNCFVTQYGWTKAHHSQHEDVN